MDDMVRAYLECALWTGIDEQPDGNGGPPLDEKYAIEDFAPVAITQAERDCAAFRGAVSGEDWIAYATAMTGPKADGGDWWSGEAFAGHDLWLTRNGHGAGFWDRGLGSLGTRLTEAAHVMGNCDVYVGDDGKVYLS